MTEYVRRTVKVMLAPKDEAGVLSETATFVSIEDDGGGEFLTVSQSDIVRERGEIAINADEWPALRELIDEMVKECRD